MMNKKLFFTISFTLGLCLCLFAQEEKSFVRKGNKAYEKGDYESAASEYRKGVEKNAYSYEANFNLGNALYKQGEFESAASQFDLLRQSGMEPKQLARAYHNLGNSFLEQKKYAESVQAFKEALRKNPADADTRYNLVYAMEKLKEQQQNQQNQDNQDNQENQDQQDQNQQDSQNQEGEDQQQENQEQQDGQEGEQNQQEQEQQQQQNKKEQQGQQGQQGEQQKPNELSRKEAERILQALQLDENNLHRKLDKKKAKGKKVKILKNW